MEIKQSKTIIVNRSQINLNPYNPKRHTEQEVKDQVKNIKKVGFNGGVKWNVLTGNLIDGHRRVKALDIIHKYNGDPDRDYQIKVEKVELDSKTEKEQMTYEALSNTKANYDLIAEYAMDIDLHGIGLSMSDISSITSIMDVTSSPVVDTLDDIIETNKENDLNPDEDKKEKIKALKQDIKEKAIARNKDEMAYITLSFTTSEAKEAFCQIVGIDPSEMFCKGEDILSMIE